MSKQKTAVDWLIDQIIDSDSKGYSIQISKLKEWQTKAKELEKKQIINIAYKQIENCHIELGEISYSKVPEELFNETFEP